MSECKNAWMDEREKPQPEVVRPKWRAEDHIEMLCRELPIVRVPFRIDTHRVRMDSRRCSWGRSKR